MAYRIWSVIDRCGVSLSKNQYAWVNKPDQNDCQQLLWQMAAGEVSYLYPIKMEIQYFK
jgi:hypothetical protein